MKKYEIRETGTNELLVDNLTQDRALELFIAYQNFYGVGSIYITEYAVPPIHRTPHMSRAQNYKNDYRLLFAELQEVGNLL